MRAEQQQRERGQRREGREQREALAGAPAAEAGRETGTHRHVDQQGDQQHRGGQVRGHRLPGVSEAYGLAPEPCLEPDQGHGSERWPDERRPVAVIDPGEDRQAEDLEADDRRHRPVGPFDPGVQIAGRRQQLAVAQRPIRACHTGVGGADDHPDRHEQDRRPEGGRGELLEAGHVVSWGAGTGRTGHSSGGSAAAFRRRLGYASVMTHTLRTVLLCAALVLLAACAQPGSSATSTATPSAPASLAPSGSGATADCPTTPAPQGTPEGWDVGSQRPSVFPQVINPAGTITCGQTRLMFSFLDDQNVPVAAPDRSVAVKVFDLGADPGAPVAEGDATLHLGDRTEGRRVRRRPRSADRRELRHRVHDRGAGGSPEVIKSLFDVQPSSGVVAVGDKAPASDTPTLADVGGDVSRISTDPAPVAAFYETSIAEAVADKKPFVVAFATPKFCVTQQCGPTLDRLKPIATRHPGVTVINVEPYELEFKDGSLQPVLTGDRLTPTATTNEWGLPTEPWVFVVDREGVVTESFMLIFSDEELEAALSAVE